MRRSRRRHRQDANDALDTFLDTVCNLFGIIIFLAMMIVVLVSTTGDEIIREEEEESRSLDAAVLEELEDRRDELDRKLDEYLQHESLAEARELEALEVDLEEAREEILLRIQMIEAYEQRIELGRDELARLADELDSIEAEIKRLKSTRAAAEKVLNRRFRTPRTTKVDTMPATMVLVNGRVYAPNDWTGLFVNDRLDAGDWCAGLKQWRPSDVDVSLTSASGECFRTGVSRVDRKVKLRKDGGIPIDMNRSLEEDPAWNAVIRNHRSDLQHLVITVSPNSFEEFALLRSAIAGAGFRYDIRIADPAIEQTLLLRDSFEPGLSTSQ